MEVNLTSGAISKIVTGKCTWKNLNPVVQLTGIDKEVTRSIVNKKWRWVMLSDGYFFQIGLIAHELFISNMLQKGSIIQLTRFEYTIVAAIVSESYILVSDFNLLRAKCGIIGHPKRYLLNETPLVVSRTTPTIPDEDRVEEPPTLKQKQVHVIDLDDVEEPPTSKQNPLTSTQKCSSHSSTQNKKQKLQSSIDVNLTSGAIGSKSSILVSDLNLLPTKCDTIGHSKRYLLNETPVVVTTTPTIPDKDHVDSDLNEDIDEDHVDSDLNEDIDEDHVDSDLNKDIDKDHVDSDLNEDIDDDHVDSDLNKDIDKDHVDSDLNKDIDKDHVDSDLNEDIDDSHHGEEPPTSKKNPSTSTRKCSSHSSSQNKKQKLQSRYDDISGFGKDITKFVSMIVDKTIEDGLRPCYKKLGTLEEGVSKIMRMMMEKNKEDVVGFKKLETLEEDVSKMAKTMMDKNKEDDVGACYEKLETLKEDVSRMTRMIMEKNNEDVVGFNKLEILEEDVSKMKKMTMEKNKEDDVGACFKKLETLEEDVSKLTRMMMEKNKEDDMGACIDKLDKMGWGAEEPIFDTALLLFLKGADYRKLWLHLKPECCEKWVKIAGSISGLLD